MNLQDENSMMLPKCRCEESKVKSCFVNSNRPSSIKINLGDFSYAAILVQRLKEKAFSIRNDLGTEKVVFLSDVLNLLKEMGFK